MNASSLMPIESKVDQIINSVLRNSRTFELEDSETYIRAVEEEMAATGLQELTDHALDAQRNIMCAIENLNTELDDAEVYEYYL